MDNQPAKRPLQFSLRTMLEVVTVAAFILALIYVKGFNTGQRYQIEAAAPNSGGVSLYMVDTTTGRLWKASDSKARKWVEVPAPPLD